ncbi:hypothetical protein PENTCL1PPCAC_5534 [Pristionchus entomophagus]|uniref:Protein kinase domain-containing protein n=1 Tax=Pristionchus entomophagus TaxID=358040 RepID=A0AAV5SKB3_9BILA|nr:hypothetical protein PENTCL1PPCAC_5534 [Pristionchus entomophagus]
MTANRGTQPYSPIELLMEELSGAYDEKVDIWSVSALLCELITGHQLFGNESGNSLKVQIEYCGQVDQVVINKIGKEMDRRNLELYSTGKKRRDFIQILRSTMKPNRNIKDSDILVNEDNLRAFINQTLQFDPERRMSADRALAHPFLRSTEPWERALPPNEEEALLSLRNHIWNEINQTA